MHADCEEKTQNRSNFNKKKLSTKSHNQSLSTTWAYDVPTWLYMNILDKRTAKEKICVLYVPCQKKKNIGK